MMIVLPVIVMGAVGIFCAAVACFALMIRED